jgi:hypothetical protein
VFFKGRRDFSQESGIIKIASIVCHRNNGTYKICMCRHTQFGNDLLATIARLAMTSTRAPGRCRTWTPLLTCRRARARSASRSFQVELKRLGSDSSVTYVRAGLLPPSVCDETKSSLLESRSVGAVKSFSSHPSAPIRTASRRRFLAIPTNIQFSNYPSELGVLTSEGGLPWKDQPLRFLW